LTDADGRVYLGRSSGYGSPEEIVASRFSYHHMRLFGFGNPQLDKFAYGDDGYVQIRGREQFSSNLAVERGGRWSVIQLMEFQVSIIDVLCT
jgi:hypothetical protein